MDNLVRSIRDLDRAEKKPEENYEAHITFDNAIISETKIQCNYSANTLRKFTSIQHLFCTHTIAIL